MKIVVEQKTLIEALGHVRHIVEKKNISPILGNVLIEAQPSEIHLTTTDLDISIKEGIKAQVLEAGETTLNINTLYEIVTRLPDGANVELKSNSETQQVTLKSGKARFQLPSLPAEQFSASLASDLPHTFKVTGAELYSLIKSTAFSMSDVESNYTMNGVYLHALEKDGAELLRAVATDGHRLAYSEQPSPKACLEMPGVIIPRKTIRLLLKLLEKSRDFDIHISLSHTQIIFSFATIQLQSRLIDGQFPNYTEVIPTNNPFTLEADRKLFLQAADRVALLSQDKTHGIKLSLSSDNLTLSAATPHAGSAVEEVLISYQGDAMETGFNASYLMQIGENIASETLVCKMKDENTPITIQGKEESGTLFVLMPIRV
jgi:DNA polymerase-3 subunit beta